MIDPALLEFSVRDDLNTKAPRVMAVLDPVKLVIENYPEGQTEELDASFWPHDVPKEGSRKVPFGRELWIEREDFAEDPPKGWYRLAPGRQVRLRYAYLVTLTDVVKDDDGEVVELRATYDPETRGGDAPDGRKVRGTLHWVADVGTRSTSRSASTIASSASSAPTRAMPTSRANLNPDSLVVVEAKLEPSLGERVAGRALPVRAPGLLLRSIRWTRRRAGRCSTAPSPCATPGPGRATTRRSASPSSGPPSVSGARQSSVPSRRKRLRPSLSDEESAVASRLAEAGVAESEAEVLARRPALASLFDAIAAAGADATVNATVKTTVKADSAARWIVHEVAAYVEDDDVESLNFGAAELAHLIHMVDAETITTSCRQRDRGRAGGERRLAERHRRRQGTREGGRRRARSSHPESAWTTTPTRWPPTAAARRHCSASSWARRCALRRAPPMPARSAEGCSKLCRQTI